MLKLAVNNEAAPAVSPQRRALLAQVHIARKSLAMEEDDYRAVIEQVTGRKSAKDCTDRELSEVVARFEELGFRPFGRPVKRRAMGTSKTVRKARAMWISLYQLGAIVDGSDVALEAFGHRQLGVQRLQWANEREGFKLIEALKAIGTRYGWDQRLSSKLSTAEKVRALKERLIGAQRTRLEAAGVAVPGALAGDCTGWPEKRLERAAAELGQLIQEHLKKD